MRNNYAIFEKKLHLKDNKAQKDKKKMSCLLEVIFMYVTLIVLNV